MSRRIPPGPVLAALVLFLAAAVLAGCAGTPTQADGLSLDEGIAQIARGLEDGLPAGSRVAVVNLESSSARFSEYVLGELQGTLTSNQRLRVTERSELERLRGEMKFQMSGEVDKNSAVSAGKFLGAQVIVYGKLTDLGGEGCRLSFNAIDVETAAQKLSRVVTVRRDDDIAALLPADTAPPPAQIPARPDPALAARYFNAGFAHYEAGRYREAAADFTLALAAKKDDTASLRYRAYAYSLLRNDDGAFTDINRLIELEPGNPDYYLTRGSIYDRKREHDKAIADYNQAIKISLHFAEAYVNRGNSYDDKGDFDKAIADYTQAIRLKPNEVYVYYNRGLAYERKRDFDRAIADYNQAIKFDPGFIYAYLQRGAIYYYKGDVDKAIAEYTQAIKIAPNFANAYLARGNIYNDGKRDFDRAIADYTQAIKFDPNMVGSYSGRGNAYANKGDTDRAIADYTQAITLNPNFAPAYANRGYAYYDKKDYARARADWERALRLNPNLADVRNNLEDLRREGY